MSARFFLKLQYHTYMNALNDYLHSVEQKWKTHYNKVDFLPDLCIETAQELNLFASARGLTTAFPHRELKRYKPHPANGIVAVAESEFLGMYFHYWFDDIATPHHHAWTGFFMNLKGRVIHSVYDFTPQEYIGPHLAFGKLENRTTELITEGMAVPVIPGAGYIHSLWHVDSPCISLSVRIKSVKFTPDALTMDYDRWSGTAFCVSQRDDVSQLFKWLQLLHKTDKAHYYRVVDDIIAQEDVTTVILLLSTVMNTEMDLDLADYLNDQPPEKAHELLKRYGDFAEGLARNRLFTNIRLNVLDSRLRGLFGALYLAMDRGHFLKIVSLLFTDQQPEKKASQLLFQAISRPEVEASRMEVKKELLGFFESILAGRHYRDFLKRIEQSSKLNSEEKEFIRQLIQETRESLIFRVLN
jgi:hypothetical protein